MYIPNIDYDYDEVGMYPKEEITLTKDHLLLTSNRGWVQAQNITEDDDVVII